MRPRRCRTKQQIDPERNDSKKSILVYYTRVDRGRLKNDQRIASAKALEEQLTNSIDALQEAVAEAKKNGGFMNRLRGMLDKIVNGEDE